MYIQNGIAYAGEPVSDIEVSAVRYLGDYVFLITFSTGETRVFDATNLFDMPVFGPLKNEETLADVSLDHGVMTWLDGDIDIAPEAVYGSSPGGAGIGGFSGSISSSNPSAGGDYNGSGRSPVMSPSEAVRLRNETNVADAEVELKKAQAREANSRATGQDNTNSIFDLFKRAQELANDNAELEKRIKAIEEKYAEANAVKDLEIKDSILRETDERISNLMSDRLYKEKATEKLKSDMDLIKAQIATESSKQHSLDADTDYKRSLTETENALREVRKQLTESERSKILQDIRNSKALTAKEIEQFAQWLNGNYPASSIGGIADKLARKFQIHGSSIDEAETIRQGLLDYLRGFKD